MNQDIEKIKKSISFEKTVVLVKPDGLQRGLIGEVISRFERKGLKLVALKMIQVDDTLLEAHYSHHVDKPFFKSLAEFMKSSPVVAMVLEGLEAVEVVRLLCGTTKPTAAVAGSIRGDFGMGLPANIVHSSDSVESAKEEIVRFFQQNEVFEYDKTEYLNIYFPD